MEGSGGRRQTLNIQSAGQCARGCHGQLVCPCGPCDRLEVGPVQRAQAITCLRPGHEALAAAPAGQAVGSVASEWQRGESPMENLLPLSNVILESSIDGNRVPGGTGRKGRPVG